MTPYGIRKKADVLARKARLLGIAEYKDKAMHAKRGDLADKVGKLADYYAEAMHKIGCGLGYGSLRAEIMARLRMPPMPVKSNCIAPLVATWKEFEEASR